MTRPRGSARFSFPFYSSLLRGRRVSRLGFTQLSGRLHPHSHLAACCLQLAIELLGFSIAMIQSSFTAFPGVGIYKRDLLNAGVIVHTYNPHIGSFLPSLGSSTNQSLLGGRGGRHCYEIKWIVFEYPNRRTVALKRQIISKHTEVNGGGLTRSVMRTQLVLISSFGKRSSLAASHFSPAYSALACLRIGTSESASFHSSKKS